PCFLLIPERGTGGAQAAVRELHLHLQSGLVTTDGTHHRPHLLVAGKQEEGGRATIALHADDKEVGLRVRQVSDAVRSDGSTGSRRGINQVGQGEGGFENWVNVETKLALQGQVRPKT